MSISIEFLLKHIRPIGLSGYTTFCSSELTTFLVDSLGFGLQDVVIIYAAWRGVALSDKYSADVVECAKDVSNARWSFLQQTSGSTVMFLDGTQLQDLSNANLSQSFTWRPASPIAVAVTIDGTHGGHRICWEAEGFSGNTDGNGKIVHFSGLI
ncbi:hypothetical protein ACFONN_17805 [Dyella humi]|uniref:Uncharacterized protein n=1 Tax=Dyella humi TaxID=1770547 RepID=A0ABW8IFZ7_9GAMM